MESKLALWTGLEVTPGSGCGFIFKGDLNDDEWLVEVKSTRQDKLIFHASWMTKAQAQAKDKGKDKYAVLFAWDERPDEYEGLSLIFAAIPEDTYGFAPQDPHISAGKSINLRNHVAELKHGDNFTVTSGDVTFLVITADTFIKQCINQS